MNEGEEMALGPVQNGGILETTLVRVQKGDKQIISDAQQAGRGAITVVATKTGTSNTVAGAVIGGTVGLAGILIAVWFGVTGSRMDEEADSENTEPE